MINKDKLEARIKGNELNALFRDWVSQEIQDYSSSKNISVSKASTALKVNGNTYRGWRAKKSTPSWNDYFMLKLRMKDENISGEDLEEKIGTLEDCLKEFVSLSINTYCASNGQTVDGFGVNDLGLGSGTLYGWANRKTLASPKGLFIVMGGVYKDKNNPEILSHIVDLDSLRNKRYIELVRLHGNIPDPENFTLDQKMKGIFKDKLTDLIAGFCKSQHTSIRAASLHFDYSAVTLASWHKQHTLPMSLKEYFEFRVKHKNEVSPISLSEEESNSLVNSLCSNLIRFVSNSISTYCSRKRMSLKKFAKSIDTFDGTVSGWINKNQMPSYDGLFEALSKVYELEDPKKVVSYITNMDALIRGEYVDMVESISGKDFDAVHFDPLNYEDYQDDGKTTSGRFASLSAEEKAHNLFDLMRALNPALFYARGLEPTERDRLREICMDKEGDLKINFDELRQLLRKEENYQKYKRGEF
jgi:transcriptional regulator with XRE-family HTH domain